MQLRKNRFVRALGVVALVGLIAAGCGSDEDPKDDSTDTTSAKSEFVEVTGVPGVTDDEIRFSVLGTVTSPTGECTVTCFAEGIQAYFDYINEAEGGVYGRKLVLEDVIDDELGKGQEKAIQIIAANDTFATFTNTLLGTVYQPFVDEKWPVFTYLTDHTLGARETVFGTFSVSAFDIPRLDHPFVPKTLGAEKIATIGYNVGSSSTCVDQAVNEFEGIYSDIATVVYSNKSLPFGLANGVAPEVTAMKSAGVEAVFTCMEANGLKAFAQEMKRQGLEAPLVTYSGFEDDFIEQNADVLEGSIQGLRIRPAIAKDSEGTKLFKTWTEKAGIDVKYTTKHGWGAADLMVSGLKKVGGPFDRQKLIDATNSIEQWTAKGMFSPIDIGRQHQGSTPDDRLTHGDMPLCFSYTQVKDGKLAFMGEETAEKPYVCWENEDYEYTEPEARDITDIEME
jgi:hypothetical protein